MERLFKRLWFEYVWYKHRHAARRNKAQVREAFVKELDAVYESVERYMAYQATEADILNDRLSSV